MITYPASIPNLVENSTPLRDNWIAGLRTRWGAVHRRCAHPECSRQFSPLLAALPSRTGILLEGLWYCGSRCFARALPHLLKHPKLARRTRRLPDHRIPLGLLMMSRGELTYEQLKTALHAQRQAAQGLGIVRPDVLDQAMRVGLQQRAANYSGFGRAVVVPGFVTNSSSVTSMVRLAAARIANAFQSHPGPLQCSVPPALTCV